ncbi:TonB family protein [Mucilaginibacter sp. HMF5004]|uniref:energy transducer TonB n=1 Tax=Mucilaginibacter rivuli TaxID=2857527 RepID=UPI001C5D1AB3|nr:energy transducer TonB [Mucilaginibacter rivuli]MBW4890788.1 TonB family protein [Mucilaginibacter rivuli]
MFPKFDIYDTEWLDLIFKGRNQSYGAYELRKHYARTMIRSMWITGGMILVIFLVALSQAEPATVSPTPSTQTSVTIDLRKEFTSEPTHVQVSAARHKHNGGTPTVIATQQAEASIVQTAQNQTKAHGESQAINKPKPASSNVLLAETVPAAAAQPQILDIPDVMPEPNGGRATLNNFLKQNLQYPEAAAKNGISGKVWLSFVVEADGHLSDIRVTQSAGFGFDEEAIRVLKLAPAWQPGTQNGQPVRVRYNLPVNFRIVK